MENSLDTWGCPYFNIILIHGFLLFYESTLPKSWNHSNRIIQTKVMAFSCQLVILPILPEGQMKYSLFRGLNFICGTIYFYYFKFKVLRVLFQLESPHSEHRNSSYVRNNSDYSMIKAGTRIWLAHGPTLSEFLGHLGS